MMRAPPIAIALSVVAGAVCAQPADKGIKDLEACFRLARAADAICSNPANAAVERLNCLRKARTAQLECLEQVSPGMSAGSEPAEMPSEAVVPNMAIGSVSPDALAGSASQEMPAKNGNISSNPPDLNWTISETTSPVDYSPLFTAVIRASSDVKNSPNTLAIRCRGLRTELMVRTEGTWRASRTSEVEIDYQINDQPVVRLAWSVSADGKTASYKDDAADFLRSLPEAARLKINVLDRPGTDHHEATFQLVGLDAIRKKSAVACKWPPPANKLSAGKR